jgi:hypothetical protein
LKGDKGTLSEFASALFLKRPVALVGPKWEDTCEQLREYSSKKPSELRDAMIALFGDAPDVALGYDPKRLREVDDPPLTYKPESPRRSRTSSTGCCPTYAIAESCPAVSHPAWTIG